MGGGTSKPPVDKDSTVVDLDSLPTPVSREDLKLFSVAPLDEELRRKGAVLLLEVGNQGFRVLRSTEDPVFLFPWGQIHSWAHGEKKFTFRYFDDSKRTVLQHNLGMRDIDALLEHIQVIIDKILSERKHSGIPTEAFEQLLEQLRGTKDAARQLELIRQAALSYTFLADQGYQVLELLPTTFDKIEAATVLHSKLIDQNRFSYMLEVLECQADRDNVWHRITQMKKAPGSRRSLVLE